MQPVRYFAAAALVVAILLLAGRIVHAQPQVQQAYGGGGGMIAGTVYGFNMYDEFVPIAWAPVSASNGHTTYVAYTGGNGYYSMYVVPSGVYNVTVTTPGYVTYTNTVAVSPGSASTSNFYLEQSHVPVPEFPSGMVSAVVLVTLASVLVAARRIKRKK